MLGQTLPGETRIQSKPRPAGSPQRSPRYDPERSVYRKEVPKRDEGEKKERTKVDKGANFALRYKAASFLWGLERELCLGPVIKDLFTSKF